MESSVPRALQQRCFPRFRCTEASDRGFSSGFVIHTRCYMTAVSWADYLSCDALAGSTFVVYAVQTLSGDYRHYCTGAVSPKSDGSRVDDLTSAVLWVSLGGP